MEILIKENRQKVLPLQFPGLTLPKQALKEHQVSLKKGLFFLTQVTETQMGKLEGWGGRNYP